MVNFTSSRASIVIALHGEWAEEKMKVPGKPTVYRVHGGSVEAPEHHQHFDRASSSHSFYKQRDLPAYVHVDDGSGQRWRIEESSID